jgi:hypothetical protein
MKIVKRILIGVVALIALLLLVALFIPKHYTVSVSETINQPKAMVMDYLKLLKNQEEYSEWVMADPNLHPEISGIDGSVGAIQRWNSKNDNVGEGEQEITAITDSRIDMEMRFKRPFEGTARAANILEVISDGQTKVTSEFYSNDKYPFNLMSYFFGRKMIQDTEVKNLKNLKKILESKME